MKKYGGFFDVPVKAKELEEIEAEIEARPDFWTNPKVSAPILKRKRAIEIELEKANKLKSWIEDLEVSIELALEGDDECKAEAILLIEKIDTGLKEAEIQTLLGGELDTNNAVITINAGAGGTESCDWASMLLRMYLRFAERKGWKTSLYDIQDGDEAGVKSATFEIEGTFSLGC